MINLIREKNWLAQKDVDEVFLQISTDYLVSLCGFYSVFA